MKYKLLFTHKCISLTKILLKDGWNMNIDKFGHHVHKRLRIAESFVNFDDTLRKSENGEFDLHFSRLKGVKSPVSNDDAVNKEYVDQLTKVIQTNLANIILHLRKIDLVLKQIEEQKLTKEDVNNKNPK